MDTFLIDGQDFMDSMLCVSGSRLIQSGLTNTNHFKERPVIFVNAGGGPIKKEGNINLDIDKDCCFEGGDVIRTDESIINGGDIPSVYQSARFGTNLNYKFNGMPVGEYLVDLHFAEIVYTNGPKGMRVFDVFIQEEKVISELDVYSIVGANKPLQVVDVRVSVGEDGVIFMRFDGVVGSPIVSGIYIKQATELPKSTVKKELLLCNNCSAEVKASSDQSRVTRTNSLAKYEKKIEELKAQCQLKTDECHEAWMSLTAANEELEKIRMELDNRFFSNMQLDQAIQKQKTELRDVSRRYECDKKLWVAAIGDLEKKMKMMKIEHSQLSDEAHGCVNNIPEFNKMITAVQVIVAQHEDLRLKLNEEQAKSKKLYNQAQEAKGNIRVFCRCRPLTKEEISNGCQTAVDFSAAKDGDLTVITSGSTKKIFKFDRVYAPKDDQVDVFADASALVTSVLDGYNVCMFAYGQTGTGKTFTMEGTEQNRGVNYRTLHQLFKIAEERKETVTYDISVSVLEVYNEQIRDLLATSTTTTKRLDIKQVSDGVQHVPGIVEAKVENIKQVWDVLQAGSNARAVGSNNVNERSSRSHCMLRTMVRAKNLVNDECTMSKLWLVDLAGSERLAKTDVQGERLKEAQNINRSLSALGDVISCLANKSSHIPYRNSKLTHLLQDSLGGDSKTLMLVQISPSDHDIGETLSSLNFATRVRGVELGPAKKQIDMGELQKFKTMLDKAKQELRSKDDAMRKLEEGFQNVDGKAKVKDQLFKNQQEKVNELESQLASKTELCRQLEKQLLQLSEGKKEKEEICSNFQQKVNELEKKLKEQEEAASMNLHFKVKELENRMKERTQEFELHTKRLQQKLKEAENKLWEKEKSESQSLQRKINVLGEELRQHEQGDCLAIPPSAEKSEATPVLSRMETIYYDVDPLGEKSLNSTNRTINQESSLLQGNAPLRELRRKGDLQSRGVENNFLISASSLEKKRLPAESSKAKPLDSSRASAKITRSTKSIRAAQKTTSNTANRINKDQGPGARDNKFKVWLR
ncbi:KINESIN-LIKE PROTEIN KLP-3 [Salix purpurea]|uniref:KINESIN-LIKE PROTEIN KLP-3 n=1 Tax=Salix purpurea TaxID=77065 RepID=A0A9Q0PCM8_SALPP|nr:KINESIN-LIKE PROTEIN KLP-3 [Salix purpurea]